MNNSRVTPAIWICNIFILKNVALESMSMAGVAFLMHIWKRKVYRSIG